MAISTQTRSLNLVPGQSAPVIVHLSQGNVGDTIKFYLYDGANPYYPSGVTISVHGVREDGASFGPFAVAATANSNLVSFNVSSAMTSVPGTGFGELVITDSNKKQIGTANFGLIIEKAPYLSGVAYEEDIVMYQRLLSYIQSLDTRMTSAINAEKTAREQAINAEKAARENAIDQAVDTMNTKVDNAVSAMNTKVDNAIKTISSAKYKKIVFLGDSLAAGWNGSGYNNTKPCTYAATKARCSQYWDWAANRGGFSSEASFNYLDILKSKASVIPDKSIVTDFIIVGGINDHDKTTLGTTIPATFNYIKSNYPNAKITVVWIGYNLYSNSLTLMEVANRYRDSVTANGGCFINGVSIMHSALPYYVSDNVHVSETGSLAIGHGLANVILNGKVDTVYRAAGTTTNVKITSAAADCAYEVLDEIGKMNIYFKPGWTDVGRISVTTDGNTDIVLCSLPSFMPPCNAVIKFRFATYVWIDDHCYKADAMMAIAQRKVHVYITAIENDNFISGTMTSLLLEMGPITRHIFEF